MTDVTPGETAAYSPQCDRYSNGPNKVANARSDEEQYGHRISMKHLKRRGMPRRPHMTISQIALLTALVLIAPLMIALAEAKGQERVVNKQDADRMFGLNRSQWEAEARQMVGPGGENVQLSLIETGSCVWSFDSQAGLGVAVQPFFRDNRKPPDKILVGSYYPAGSFPGGFTKRLKRNVEAGARSDLGPTYSVNVSFRRKVSLPPGIAAPQPGFFDVVEIIITRAQR